MAAKAANVIDRKESNIKEQAEEIMDMHGIPVSLSGSGAPAARDELDDAAFYAMMEHGLKEAKANQSRLASDGSKTEDAVNAGKEV